VSASLPHITPQSEGEPSLFWSHERQGISGCLVAIYFRRRCRSCDKDLLEKEEEEEEKEEEEEEEEVSEVMFPVCDKGPGLGQTSPQQGPGNQLGRDPAPA
jgi:hypothetical protein